MNMVEGERGTEMVTETSKVTRGKRNKPRFGTIVASEIGVAATKNS